LGAATTLTPCAGEAELADPAVAGQFAGEMAAIAASSHVAPWCGYVARRDGRAVGFGGFKGEPVDGVVEIGYLTFPPYEGTGVASDVTAQMLNTARDAGAKRVIAHTLPEENASTGVLRHNGFEQTGKAHDPDEGAVWRWECSL
jgi:[ribosomal protein S5]-alanine N-acetyltransferase